ncbi:ABC transporter substrate-binding protein [Myroides fluvii]|uniref:ABC transporter substrate-binding protein n=1 Tax=Myroides fluvii TaxID=2572594 RepID=UPI00131C0799|nr:ABC transporter substrate-binding protein [Myroides fluvii]
MKSIIYYISILCVVFTVYSCQNKRDKNERGAVFRYNESSNIQTLDPAFARSMAIIWPCNQLFNGLVQLDDQLNVVGDIAQSWKASPDGLTYDFTLRQGVYFHPHSAFGPKQTRAVTASDFVYSLDRLTDARTASPGAWIMQKVKRYTALNDTVFRLELKESFPAILGLLSMRYASVVPREVVEDSQHDFRTHPIGTGPFYFKFWEENVKLILRRNPRYFEKDEKGVQLPYLESVAITFLPDKQSAFLQFIQGKLDFISGLDPSYKDDLITLEGQLQEKYQPVVQMETGPYLNTEYLGFNMEEKQSAIQDKRIRQALNMGFDREKMIKHLRSGMGTTQVGGIIPKGLKGNIQPKVRYDVTTAKALVEEYKKEYKQSKVVIALSTNAGYLDIAEYLQREWQKIGLTVEIDVMPPATLRQGMASGKIAFFRGSWIADYPDAENYLSLFYSKNKAPNGPNYTFFSNTGYDQLYEKALQVTDQKIREQLYEQMDQLIAEEVPALILFYDQAVRFSRKDIRQLGINPMNNLFLKKVSKD